MYRKVQKNRKFYILSLSKPHFFPQIDFWHGLDTPQWHLKAFYPYSCCLTHLRGVKMVGIACFEHFWPNWPPSKMPNNINMGKTLWNVVVVYHNHARNRFEEENGASIEKKCQIFDFFELFYTFTLNFPYKIWPTGGGVKWPPMKPKFFLTTFFNICAQEKK